MNLTHTFDLDSYVDKSFAVGIEVEPELKECHLALKREFYVIARTAVLLWIQLLQRLKQEEYGSNFPVICDRWLKEAKVTLDEQYPYLFQIKEGYSGNVFSLWCKCAAILSFRPEGVIVGEIKIKTNE